MTDPVYVTKVVEAYRKTAAALGRIADRFDSHASTIVTLDEGLGSVARGYAIDLFALQRRLDALSDDVMTATRKQASLMRKRK